MKLQTQDILIAGQLTTSRTDTLEDYLYCRSHALAVIGLMSPFARLNRSRCTYYAGGRKVRERPLPHFGTRGYWAIGLTALWYVFSFCAALLFLRRRFHLFIGVATFPAFMGVVLKICGLVDKTVYYCLDYYPPPRTPALHRCLNFLFRHMDSFVVRHADLVWSLSPALSGARARYSKIDAAAYKELVVPLGYADEVCRDLPFGQRERWTLGFVGTLSPNQGLQLAIEAMPELRVMFPEVRVRVIGGGLFAGQLKQMAERSGVAGHFIFHGFVPSDEEVYSILSRCMAGLALWMCRPDDNALYADTGKPKLYAMLGLPVIITQDAFSAAAVRETQAGLTIPYDKAAFINAVTRIISDEASFERYHAAIKRFTPLCRSVSIFDRAFDAMSAMHFS